MSKKILISAITTALVVGAASTTFAAANPFSDVPADSWAYDAVATLAADGVVDGYPDGTYKGQNTMTRYEMAQIIARAMAKTDLEKADKTLVDKLAIEFAKELDNLGIRVADLEQKSDNVKFAGELRYRYYDAKTDLENGKEKKDRYNKIMFRLEPKVYIGDSGWTANARIGYLLNVGTSSNAANANDTKDNDATVDRIYVNGKLFGTNFTAGKFGVFAAQGLYLDNRMTGAQAVFGSDIFKTTMYAGRYDGTPSGNYDSDNARDITAELYGLQFDYKANNKLNLNAGYTKFAGLDDKEPEFSFKDLDDTSLGLWTLGGKYAFDSNIALIGQYAESNVDKYEKAGSIQMQYKGANPIDVGSWGAFLGYRHLGSNVAFAVTYNDASSDQKGYVAGASYVPAENIMATMCYFNGKTISTDKDASKLFGQIEFFF